MWSLISRQADSEGNIFYKYSKENDFLDGLIKFIPSEKRFMVVRLSQLDDNGHWAGKVGRFIAKHFESGDLPDKKVIAIG